MSIESNSVITAEEFAVLERQQFVCMPQSIWQALQVSRLNNTAKTIYSHLYFEANKNRAHHGVVKPVLITQTKLAKIVDRQITAVREAIAKLKQDGWLKVEQRFHGKTGAQQACFYWIGLPLARRSNILTVKPRKNKAHPHVPQDCTEPDATKLDELKNNAALTGSPELNLASPTINESANTLIAQTLQVERAALLPAYQAKVKEFQQTGIKIGQAHRLALDAFTGAAREELTQLLLTAPTPTSEKVLCSEEIKNTVGGSAKTATYQQDLNQYKNVNKEKPKPIAKLAEFSLPAEVVVDFNKNQPVDVVRLTILARLELEKLQQARAIPSNIFANGKNLGGLVEELIFHATHYDSPKLRSAEHALRAGIKLVKHGQWDTPLKLRCQRYRETLSREKAALAFKPWLTKTSQSTVKLHPAALPMVANFLPMTLMN